MLVLGIAAMILTDSVYVIQIQHGTFVSGGILADGWVLSYLLIGLAGIREVCTHPSNRPEAICSIQGRRADWTHILPVLWFGVVSVFFIWDREVVPFINQSGMIAGFGFIIGLILIRQKVSLDESNQLLAKSLSENDNRRRAEDALRKSEYEKAAILGGLRKVAVEYLDPNMNVIWVNSSLQDYLEISENDVKGKQCYKIIQNIEKPCDGCVAFKALQTGQSQEGEVITPDGKAWLSRANIIRDENANLLGVVNVALNITSRKKAEDSLKESECRLANIIDSLPDATIVIDKMGRVIAWNHATEDMTGVKAEQILGKGDYEYSIPLYGERTAGLIDMVLRPGLVPDSRYNNLRKREDGSIVGESLISNPRSGEKYLMGTASMLCDSQGKCWGAIESIRDITDRKRSEEELKKAKICAESATKAKSEFLANMSHEIRTPLNAVIGMTDLLLYEHLSDYQKQSVEIINSSANGLLSIINNILDLSKIEAGMIELERKPFYLHDCLDEALHIVGIDAAKKSLEMELRFKENIPSVVLGDPTKINQILNNLLSNAVKFTEKGKISILVSGRTLESGALEIHFAITDTGIGIPEDKMMGLFQSFSQVDASIARRYGGTGLGLVISKRLAESMGGRMWVVSEVNKGSTFNFTIQVVPTICEPIEIGSKSINGESKSINGESKSINGESKSINGESKSINGESKSINGESKSHADTSHGLRILLAEDNPVNQIVVKKMLSKLGYRAKLVENGIQVIQATDKNRYDVILMDVQMPEMDGLKATKIIRQRSRDLDRPIIIAMTAFALSGDKEMCLAAGMDGYLSKPIKLDQLKNVLESCRMGTYH